MKVDELRQLLERYTNEQLRFLLIELYKTIPKKVKEAKYLDDFLRRPQSASERKKAKPRPPEIDVEDLEFETDEFIKNAYAQNYFAPNSVIHKNDRPQWRFVVKRLFKAWLVAAQDPVNLTTAIDKLEELYILLCYCYSTLLFSTEDPFRSIGITQPDFFRNILVLKRKKLPTKDFVVESLALMADNYYPYSSPTLMEVFLEFQSTPDLLELSIRSCEDLIRRKKSRPRDAETRWSNAAAETVSRIEHLTETAFHCYAKLHDCEAGIVFFKQHYPQPNPQLKLSILLRLLFKLKEADLLLKEYDLAVASSVHPGPQLTQLVNHLRRTGQLPAYFW